MRKFAILCLLLVFHVGCRQQESRWDAAQQTTVNNSDSTSDAALPGSAFNKFFPEQGDGYDIVFKQEKDGFAQASLVRENTAIAMLSISDTRNNPTARDKYADVADKAAGYPVVVRENTTSILVADRFQVQVQSTDGTVTAEDRIAWLGKFDLGGLSNAF